jgi:hypothetical protein
VLLGGGNVIVAFFVLLFTFTSFILNGFYWCNRSPWIICWVIMFDDNGVTNWISFAGCFRNNGLLVDGVHQLFILTLLVCNISCVYSWVLIELNWLNRNNPDKGSIVIVFAVAESSLNIHCSHQQLIMLTGAVLISFCSFYLLLLFAVVLDE